MDQHKRTLGILFVVLATFQLLVVAFLSIIVNAIFGFAASQNPDDAEAIEFVSQLLHFLPVFILLFFVAPSLIAGLVLLAKKGWAMILALIIGCLNIFSFPFGTAIAIYGIWIYIEDQKQTKAAAANQA